MWGVWVSLRACKIGWGVSRSLLVGNCFVAGHVGGGYFALFSVYGYVANATWICMSSRVMGRG